MELAEPKSGVVAVARDTTRLGLALQHHHVVHARLAQRPSGGESGWAAADDDGVVPAHAASLATSPAAGGMSMCPAASWATRQAQ